MERIKYKKADLIGNNGILFMEEVFSNIKSLKRKRRKALFLCHCGKFFKSNITTVKSGGTASCGCKSYNHTKLPRKFKSIEYERGLIMGSHNIKYLEERESYYSPNGIRSRKALFECYCGNQWETHINSIKNNKTISCGCHNPIHKKGKNNINWNGGLKKHPSYKRYYGMIERCYNKEATGFINYGGRGIRVSNEFLDNKWFYLNHIDSLPNAYKKGYTIDRIENDGNYERGNLRWATKTEQANNSRAVLG